MWVIGIKNTYLRIYGRKKLKLFKVNMHHLTFQLFRLYSIAYCRVRGYLLAGNFKTYRSPVPHPNGLINPVRWGRLQASRQ